ncbi:MAG: MerR family transcriptional regulator [Clostridia bacterium]|nr:MerR family transcriptional regulator [Clostridia bacterium]
MYIHDVSKLTDLTKKAIEYYTEKELVCPVTLENGYRDFSEDDVDRLKKISILRKLGLGIEEVKAVLADETHELLQKAAIRKELSIQRDEARKALIDRLCYGSDVFITFVP